MKQIAILRLVILLLVPLVACGGGGSSSAKCNINQCADIGLNSKIINGRECSTLGSPLLDLSIAPPGDFVDTCTGILIAPNAVLTAAHCLPTTTEGVFAIYEGNQIPAVRVVRHPGYRIDDTQGLVFDDIGIIFLATTIPATPLPLIVSKQPVIGEKISIFGFGLTEDGTRGLLHSGQMEITGVSTTHVFATYDDTNCSNTCGGDSGGPAIEMLPNQDGGESPGVLGTLSSGTDIACGLGDTSAFMISSQPQLVEFVRLLVPTVGLI